MEAGCQDYLKHLSTNIEGGMGFVISSWDNTDGAYKAVEECPEMCSAPAQSCENAVNAISDFKVYQWGYTEDPTPTPEPEPPTPDPDEDSEEEEDEEEEDDEEDDDQPEPSPGPEPA